MNIRGEIMLFCKYLKKAGIIERNPEDLEIPDTADYVGREILKPEQLLAFLQDDDGRWTYLCAWQLACIWGFRPGESYALWETDITDGSLFVKRALNARNKLTKGKNRRATRSLVETEIARIIIDRQKARKTRWGVVSKWLFCDKFAQQPNARSAYTEWDKY